MRADVNPPPPPLLGAPKKARAKKQARPRWVYEPAVSVASPYWDTLAVTSAVTTVAAEVITASTLPQQSGLSSRN
jgi:hypothetical protein